MIIFLLLISSLISCSRRIYRVWFQSLPNVGDLFYGAPPSLRTNEPHAPGGQLQGVMSWKGHPGKGASSSSVLALRWLLPGGSISCRERGVKMPAVTLEVSVSPFNFVHFCFPCFGPLASHSRADASLWAVSRPWCPREMPLPLFLLRPSVSPDTAFSVHERPAQWTACRWPCSAIRCADHLWFCGHVQWAPWWLDSGFHYLFSLLFFFCSFFILLFPSFDYLKIFRFHFNLSISFCLLIFHCCHRN